MGSRGRVVSVFGWGLGVISGQAAGGGVRLGSRGLGFVFGQVWEGVLWLGQVIFGFSDQKH